jgi:hypothetical protein
MGFSVMHHLFVVTITALKLAQIGVANGYFQKDCRT